MSRIPYYVVAGLGNVTHPNTRHSVGHLIVDSLAARFGVRMELNEATKCWEGSKDVNMSTQYSTPTSGNVVFVKHKPPMNICGKPIVSVLDKYIRPRTLKKLIVIHDSLEHRPFTLNPKKGGSAEGHNGVRNIIYQCNGDDKFRRIRVGIGKDTTNVARYVLQPLSREEVDYWSVEGLDDVWRLIQQLAVEP
ncbi:peptidyl-tRNA hydrolase [Hysterangium stoloniferum]|nr:peptidyl-tRNA hydrolase [Hysterangium stoloniferum]